MIVNKIFLGSDGITIFDVVYGDLETIKKWAGRLDCTVKLLKDDGTYMGLKIIGKEKNLYNFMQIVFTVVSGVVG